MKIKIGISSLILPAMLMFALSSPLRAQEMVDDQDSDFDSPLTISDEEDETTEVEESAEIEEADTEITTDEANQKSSANYIFVNGRITQLEEGETDGNGRILIATDDGEDIYYNLHENLRIYNLDTKSTATVEDLEDAQEIKAFYSGNTPAALSDPAQINPEVIVIGDFEKGKVKVDYFDEKGLSGDGQLQLNLDENTVVHSIDGEDLAVEQALGKTLLVFYTVETRSLPPQTSPEMVVVLSEDDALEPEVVEPTETTELTQQPEATGVAEVLQGIPPEYLFEEDGEEYVAVAIAAEAMGYDVQWNPDTAEVTLEKGEESIHFTIGQTTHTKGSFQYPPFIRNDRTFVEKTFLEYLQ